MIVEDEASLGGLPGLGRFVPPKKGSGRKFDMTGSVDFPGVSSSSDSIHDDLSSCVVDDLLLGASRCVVDSSPQMIAFPKIHLFVFDLEGLCFVREVEILLESVRIVPVLRDFAPVEAARGVDDPDWMFSESGLDKRSM